MKRDMKILVVDDFEAMRSIVIRLLAELGLGQVEEAADGLAALSRLRDGGFDFLITGWNMPGMEGIELLRTVRDDPSLASLPVLMITAEARRDQIMEAVEAGVDGYIVKPFTGDTLRDKVERIFP